MEYKLQADPLRHYNKSLFLRNQDHPRNYKQMSFTRSHAPIVRGVISVRLLDVYKQGRKNILETQKPLKKVPTLLHMPSWTTIPSTLTMHAWLTREISVLEKLWNPGTQQLRTMLTIMRNNYQDNIQFYFEPHISIFLLAHKHFYCFYHNFVFFFHTLLSIYFKGVWYPKIWRCSWKIQFLGDTRLKTLEDMSKTFWNDLAEFPSRWVWNLRKVHSGISFFT